MIDRPDPDLDCLAAAVRLAELEREQTDLALAEIELERRTAGMLEFRPLVEVSR